MQIKVAVEDAMVGIRVMVEIEKIEKIEIDHTRSIGTKWNKRSEDTIRKASAHGRYLMAILE